MTNCSSAKIDVIEIHRPSSFEEHVNSIALDPFSMIVEGKGVAAENPSQH
jgi:hypothetical protein